MSSTYEMVSRRHRITGVPRPVPVGPTVLRAPAVLCALAVLLAPALTACGGGVHGTPGGSGLRDPYFPKAGNGGYDVTHYDLTFDVDPAAQLIHSTAVVTARATQ